MKKLMSVMLALLLASTILYGCGAKTPTSPSSATVPSASAPLATQPLPTTAPTSAPAAPADPSVSNKYVTGNSNVNLNAGGVIARQGDWIFYSGLYDGFYKSKSDGTMKTKLSDSIGLYLNIVEDWVYYCTWDKKGNLGPARRMKTDGTQEMDLSIGIASYMNIVGDWLYYKIPRGDIMENWDDGLYRIKLDGTEQSLVTNDRSTDIFIFDEWIYYKNQNDKPVLTKMRTDGTEKSAIGDSGFHWNHVDDNYIYYITWKNETSTLNKMYADGTGKTEIADIRISNSLISITETWIYYLNESDEDKLYMIRIDGSGNEKINDNIASRIYVLDDLLFCTIQANTPNENLFRIFTDGTGMIELK
ncbi:MAG: DUF5050 domain-containing protein [Youngiibacter sp.]|nr:DUF5050 domain-containing protein [Youngiibacter sp.]